jgi:hypothetical protein
VAFEAQAGAKVLALGRGARPICTLENDEKRLQ